MDTRHWISRDIEPAMQPFISALERGTYGLHDADRLYPSEQLWDSITLVQACTRPGAWVARWVRVLGDDLRHCVDTPTFWRHDVDRHWRDADALDELARLSRAMAGITR